MVAAFAITDSYTCSTDNMQTVRTKTPAPDNIKLQDIYIGVLREKDAETMVPHSVSFRLYYQMPDEKSISKLPSELPLKLCYRTSEGKTW